jgi:hypothetical protein
MGMVVLAFWAECAVPKSIPALFGRMIERAD